MPLVEEELSVEKHAREAGPVRVRKDVVTEEKQVTVPVTREEVHVERVPSTGEAGAGTSAFREQEVTMPVREEEIEIHKRPVVKEEVRVSKQARQEEKSASATLRKEVADVDEGGRVLGEDELPTQP